MKLVNLILILNLLMPIVSSAQTATSITPLVIDNTNIYMGIDNVIARLNPKLRNQLIFRSNNGTISIDEFNHVHFVPNKTGYTNLEVSMVNDDGDTSFIGQYSLFVNNIPRPKASIGGKYLSGDSININQIIYEEGLAVTLKPPFEVRFTTLSYDVLIVRGNKLIFNESVRGSYFTKSLKNYLKTLKTGDLLIFKDIVARNNNQNTAFHLTPLMCTIR